MALVPNIKYKTEYCLYWQEGKLCEKGAYCFFAHGEQELRTIEENHKEITLRNTQAGLSQTKLPNYKTVFCKFYAQGQCKLGEQCTYAHQRREKRKKRPSQQYKSENPYSIGNLNAFQNYDYYNQYCYQQFYQNYAQHQWFAQQPMPPLQYERQMSYEQELLQGQKVEDIKISGQYNKIITQNNSNSTKQKSQHIHDMQNSGEMSSKSTSTASPVHQPLPSLRLSSKEIEQKHQL